MSIAVTNTKSVAVEIETTEGTYVAPTSAASFVQTLDSGFEIKESKELLERSVFTGTIGKVTPRTGTRSVSGNVPTECRAFSTEGGAPEFDKLMRSAFGTRRQNTTTITTKSGNTASVLQIEDADIASLNVGDMVKINMAGAHHVSPITAKTTGTGTATVTLLVPHPSGDVTDGATISKFTTYVPSETAPTVSITEYTDNAIKRTAFGCRVNKFALSEFATGKIPKLAFGFDGLDFSRSLEAPTYTPDYDSTLPPIVLKAKAYMDNTALTINELSVSMENTVGFATSISTSNGKISSRLTKRDVTGTINPYQETTDISNYTKFVSGTEFSLFAYAANDTAVAGEFENVVAVYMPKCLITELGQGDADGLVQETLTYIASKGPDGAASELFFAFI